MVKVRLRGRRRRERGELVSLYRVDRLHADRGRALRTGACFIAAARLAASATVLLGLLAGALLWWRPDQTGQEQALATGGAALGCGVLWVMVVWRAACWLRRGMIADRGSTPQVVAGLEPDNQGEPDWLWDTLRLAHLVLLCIPLAGLVLALVSAVMPEEAGAWSGWARWGITGFSLLMTGLMGGIIGGLAFGLAAPGEESWTPRGAARRLVVYAVPFLLAVPWLSGRHAPWTGALAGAAALWLLIGPINQVAKHIPGTAAD
ncbi:hypothetical protein [Streptomyces luteogriseus]|uniref:hypothetical protein n=1 Tax=Streptomyces luteogriseus TaxID=68233 RepID=UPI002E311546|nr:hypothetical protein [Streptomyces luteogriseus]WTJ25655.1 hypothetical protein OID52_00525 [Streptomyces luteogriseus]